MRSAARAFTLIELLVVVAIIALLISILLPSLRCARDQARAARCGVQLRSLGGGLNAYATEQKDWIPGVNTSGATFNIEYLSNTAALLGTLRKSGRPVQDWDWITPIIRYDGDMGDTRAKRFQLVVNRYQCPTNEGLKVDDLYPDNLAGVIDAADFRALLENWSPLSYLMPAHFQLWGQSDTGRRIWASGFTVITAKVADPDWEAYPTNYRSRLSELGNPSQKIAASDGTRYLDETGTLDHDVRPFGTQFGSFTSAGAWWCGDAAYGVRQGSTNWAGKTVNAGTWPLNKGNALRLSYRHGCASGDAPTDAQSNKGSINAMFFDGHVTRLNDRQSREISYWYPKGSVVKKSAEGMTDVPDGFVLQ